MVDTSKPTLSLCIIVGSGESFELNRCLESVQGRLFDEVCITVTSDDKSVEDVALKYADKVSYFEWCDDFSKARNYSFSKATMSHIMWLDADDVIKDENYQKLLKLKQELNSYDAVLIDYVYAHDADDNPTVILPRERIVRNDTNIKWVDPIHEYLDLSTCTNVHRVMDIKVDHYREREFNPDRNIKLLKTEFDKGSPSPRVCFYYGKELIESGVNKELGVQILQDLIESEKGFIDNLTVASIRVANYYMGLGDRDKAKTYAMRGIVFNNGYAENYVILGNIARDSGDYSTAIHYYKEASTKELVGGMSQIKDYYDFIPYANIALVALHIKDYSTCIEYAKKALKLKPKNDQLKQVLKTAELEGGYTIDTNTEFFDRVKHILAKSGYSAELLEASNSCVDIRVVDKVKPSIGWLCLNDNLYNPVFRIRTFNMHKELKAQGVDSKLIKDYRSMSHETLLEIADSINVAVINTYGPQELVIVNMLKDAGVKVIYDMSEAVFTGGYQDVIMDSCDLITTCSDYLTSMVTQKGYQNVLTVVDAIEIEVDRLAKDYRDRYDRPKALYMGMGGNSFLVTEYLRDAIEKAGYELVTITEWDDATKKWDINTWPEDMLECDVVLCPQRVAVQPAKSNVKVTTAMALGMPVIASPLPAYISIIDNGVNGYICDSTDEWYKALKELRDPDNREYIGRQARLSISFYRKEDVARRYKDVLNNLIANFYVRGEGSRELPNDSTNSYKDPVDIIIPNYNNVEYLKMLMSSILLNTIHPFRIIISDAGSGDEVWEYLDTLKGIVILGSKGERKTFSEACNDGIAASKSKYLAILNSDLIVSKGWLGNIVDKMDSEDRLAACGVLSNCDRGWLFDNPSIPNSPKYDMYLEESGTDLIPGMTIDQIKPHIDELYTFMDKSNKMHSGSFLEQEWVAAYATVFARSALDEVGYFDTIYSNGCEDLDLCRRLSLKGYRIGQAIDSFVFHFGGISRGAYQEENKEVYNAEDRRNYELYRDKWSRKHIVIWTGPAWEPWTRKEVDEGMAGSETWAAYIAESFAKRGYRVTIYNHLPEEYREEPLITEYDVFDGMAVDGNIGKGTVTYRHYTNIEEDLKYELVDYFIMSRTVEPINLNIHSIKRYVMIHDIWLSPDRGYDIKSAYIDGYGYLSEWHKQFLIGHHNMPENKMFLTANGVNLDLYSDVDTYSKINQIVYSSSPDRGLEMLLEVFPDLRKAIPDLKLVVAYGFHNWESSAKARNDSASLESIRKIKEALKQEGVSYVGRVSKEELANYQKQSKWWLYPTWFTETFCISAVENGLANNVLISTELAGLITTVGSAGELVSPEGDRADFVNRFKERALEIMTDAEKTKHLSEKAREKMSSYTWDSVALNWISMFT